MNHIKCTTEENRSWCGKEIEPGFHFKDTEQAVINGVHGTIMPCEDCVTKVLHHLLRIITGVKAMDEAIGKDIIDSWEKDDDVLC